MKVGITNSGDAGLDFSWTNRLLKANIIITKYLTPDNTRLIEELVKHKAEIILHIGCSGYGQSCMEPNIPAPETILEGFKLLIAEGFPVENVVLRTDPIIPSIPCLKLTENVWKMFADTGIKRVRYSIINLYPHTQDKIKQVFGALPFSGFSAPDHMIRRTLETMSNYRYIYNFEGCNSYEDPIGCISYKDFDVLGLNKSEFEPIKHKKSTCNCCSEKVELLDSRIKCTGNCLYCYLN